MNEKAAKDDSQPNKSENLSSQVKNHILAESFNLDSLDIDKINKLSGKQ